MEFKSNTTILRQQEKKKKKLNLKYALVDVFFHRPFGVVVWATTSLSFIVVGGKYVILNFLISENFFFYKTEETFLSMATAFKYFVLPHKDTIIFSFLFLSLAKKIFFNKFLIDCELLHKYGNDINVNI